MQNDINNDTHDVLVDLLQAPAAAPLADLADWRQRWLALMAAHPDDSPADRAIRGGAMADRLGWAFSAGYQAAMMAGFPQDAVAGLQAFCATEAGGNRPRDISTVLQREGDQWRMSGVKTWSTFGQACDTLFVVARFEDDCHEKDVPRPRLKVVRVPASAAGVEFQPQPPLPFIPEVPHCGVAFESVVLPEDAVLPGDGYSDYLKPFRTIEDIHVMLALLAYALREVRRLGGASEASLLSALGAAMASAAALARRDPAAPLTHWLLDVALNDAAALYERVGQLLAEHPADPATTRWQRDARLFGIAGKARALRAQRARELLGLTS
ncbi:acyl-CoA dehydrogenase family protein [Alcanivorax sp. JB21]|uniref:acyl-CoA dehydrogenase family protein n=1 Tax=Alcanivorax limicola TaxID=2874102 RepID=UPI001CBC4483|nr:acyl-CoA dehydrogenase family protein [Alcanivorax limicola]MBZ2190413.1 acyl-CoA dehydrogenase family protein [Alcanivorax limicola]